MAQQTIWVVVRPVAGTMAAFTKREDADTYTWSDGNEWIEEAILYDSAIEALEQLTWKGRIKDD